MKLAHLSNTLGEPPMFTQQCAKIGACGEREVLFRFTKQTAFFFTKAFQCFVMIGKKFQINLCVLCACGEGFGAFNLGFNSMVIALCAGEANIRRK